MTEEFAIPTEKIKDKKAREEYGKKLNLPDIRYLEILAYTRGMREGLTDEEIIKKYELPYDKDHI